MSSYPNTLSPLDDDDDYDLFSAVTSTSQLLKSGIKSAQVSQTKPKKKSVYSKGSDGKYWPKRHLHRCGRYYLFFKIYNVLNQIINNRQCTDAAGELPNYSDYEVNELKDIKNRLEKLRKNRFEEYKRMKENEKLNEIKTPF